MIALVSNQKQPNPNILGGSVTKNWKHSYDIHFELESILDAIDLSLTYLSFKYPSMNITTFLFMQVELKIVMFLVISHILQEWSK